MSSKHETIFRSFQIIAAPPSVCERIRRSEGHVGRKAQTNYHSLTCFAVIKARTGPTKYENVSIFGGQTVTYQEKYIKKLMQQS